ncbi:MAG: aminopeptidase, partial [Pseudomonadota bacterium]
MRFFIFAAVAAVVSSVAHAQGIQQTKGTFEDKFRQLDEVLPTPNIYRNAAGEPGHEYWQQKVDYDIDVTLNEDARRVTATETVAYKNNSPDTLRYLWLQLDQNIFKEDSMAELTNDFGGLGRRGPATKAPGAEGRNSPPKMSFEELRRQQSFDDNEYGYEITALVDGGGKALPYTIVGTLMRIDLPTPLSPGMSTEFKLSWAFNVVEEDAVSARSGYEHFPDDDREGGNDIFLFAQWFPRLVVYSDYEGWHNKE